jgi:hypothetical protein
MYIVWQVSISVNVNEYAAVDALLSGIDLHTIHGLLLAALF